MKSRHTFLHGLLITSLLGPLDADSIDPVQWKADSLAKMEELGSLPPEEAIPELGRWLLKLSFRTTTIEGKWDVHAAAQEQLLSIPGHAEWYRDDILGRYRDWELLEGPAMAARWVKFERTRAWSFETLKEMPSVETVRVLGEMLGEEEDGYVMEPPPAANLDYWAASILTDLGIKSPPIPPGIRGSWAEPSTAKLKAWRLWYGQVKAGNRTFRFEGDDTEYTLDGPFRVATASSGKPRGDEAPVGEVEESNGKPGRWWPLVLALGLLLLAVGFVFRKRVRNTTG